MAFADPQVRKLKARLRPHHVRMREAEGQVLHYLEGWHVVAEANRIFGFDGWDRETIASTCVWTKQVGARYCAAYVARVRITVRAGDDRIVREGSGAGESNAASPGQAHERASKAAETDATKRALITFGNPFGLSLHAGNGTLDPPLSANSGTKPPAKDHQLASHTGQSSTDQQTNAAFHPGKPSRRDRGLVPGGTWASAESSAVVLPSGGGPLPQGVMPSRTTLNTEPQTNTVAASPSDENGPAMEGQERQATPNLDPPIPSASGASGTSRQEQDHEPADAADIEASNAAIAVSGLNGQSPQSRIDKSLLAIAEPRRIRDIEHLRFVTTQPCLICGREPTEAHHLRFAQARALGRKVSDAFTVPLCALHHRELHARGNEKAWWSDKGRDPLPIANELWAARQGSIAR